MSNKPRELFLDGDSEELYGSWYYREIDKDAKAYNKLHVIEYSAYEQALEDCRIAGRETAAIEIELEALRKERDELVQKMQEYKCAVAEMPQMDGGSPNEVAAQLLQYQRAFRSKTMDFDCLNNSYNKCTEERDQLRADLKLVQTELEKLKNEKS